MTKLSEQQRLAREAARGHGVAGASQFGYQQHSTPSSDAFMAVPDALTPEQESALEERLRQEEREANEREELREQSRASIQRRADLLRAEGYADAQATPDPFDPETTKHRPEWWAHSFAHAEQAKGGGYDIMPDDYTPGMTEGRALSGNRRTHRIKYEGAGVQLRMPSATSIRKYAKELKGRTFDVPVEANTPAGTVMGHVRITPGPNGTWSVSGVRMPDGRNEYVSEAVQAILEDRRPSLALAQTQDLLERRRERLFAAGTKQSPPKYASTFIEGVGYNQYSAEMTFNLSGRQYGYKVPPEVAKNMLTSSNPGRAYAALIKGKRRRFDVVECPKCRRFINEDTADMHQCHTGHRTPTRAIKFHRAQILEAITGKLSSRQREQKARAKAREGRHEDAGA